MEQTWKAIKKVNEFKDIFKSVSHFGFSLVKVTTSSWYANILNLFTYLITLSLIIIESFI